MAVAAAGAADDQRLYRITGLRGRRSAGRPPPTTHWSAFDELTAADPSIQIRPEDRYVDDGDVHRLSRSVGGIDMALHLVTRLVGVERARQIRRGIQYDPQPPV